MVEHSKPFVEKLLVEKYAPGRIFKKLNRSFVEVTELLQTMPDELMWLLRSLRKGELNVGIKIKYMEKILMEIDRASSRLSFSLIIASIIVGSSLITTLNRGPFIFGYPIVGILGFFIAGVLGLGLVVDIIWRGKLK
jgi:ubiquinone biosynthesis protein